MTDHRTLDPGLPPLVAVALAQAKTELGELCSTDPARIDRALAPLIETIVEYVRATQEPPP